jgi:YQGE family putative transporter
MDRHNSHLHILKYHHFRSALHDKFNDLVIADTFRLLALSIISIFIPIFLLDKVRMSLAEVALCELGGFIMSIFLHYAIIAISGRIGVKKIMIGSYLTNIITCIVLYFGAQLYISLGAPLFIGLIVILNSLPLSMYWSAHHVYFLKSAGSRDEGRKLGILQSVPMVISIAGPFIGSILIAHYSFRGVFLMSIVLLLSASFSLTFSDDIKSEVKLSWKRIIDTKHFKKNSVFFLQGLGYCATSFVWPVLLFFASINLVMMGFFYLLSNLLNGIIVFIGGKDADINGTNRIIKIGAAGHSLSIIMRALSETVLFMATFQSMGGFFGGLLHVAIDTGFYKNSHKNIGNAIMNRELYMHLGRITTILALLLALSVFPLKLALIAVLLLAGASTFLLLLIVGNDYSFMEETFPEKINFTVS